MTMSSMQRRAAPPPTADLPPYPEHHAASSISQQMATRAAHWGQTARGLRDEIAATEEALVAALDAQERRETNRARLHEALKTNTDRGLR